MFRVAHFQPLKQHIQRRLVGIILLPHLTGAQHFHDHRKVLLIGRRFVVEIVDQRRQQHSGRRVPKRVIGLAALGCGRLEQIRHQHLHLVVIGQIDEWVIAVTFLHVQQIQHPDLISGFLQQPSGIAKQLAFGVKADKGRTLRRQASLIQAGLGIRTGLARAAAADDNGIQVALVLAAV